VGALLSLAGCANGDFGEVRPSLVRDDIHDWIGSRTVPVPSNFELTDDERALRDLAYPLIEPPYDRHRWYSVAGEYGLLEYARSANAHVGDYSNHLMAGEVRSPSSRYARLIDDIRNDSTRLPAFFETAGRVFDMDQKRRKSLAFVGAVPPGTKASVFSRIQENRGVVGMVYTRLAQRTASYRLALGRLVIETPSNQAVEAERLLNRLDGQLAHYRKILPPTWVREPSLGANT
jgi:hypothetical protein